MDQLSENTESALAIPPQRKPVGWYDETVPARGCRLSLKEVQELYEELSSINRKFGEDVIATLPRDAQMTDEEWWRAPIGWSGLIVSASSVSGPLARCFPARADDSPRSCGA